MFCDVLTPNLFAVVDRTREMMKAFRATNGDYIIDQSWSGLLITLTSFGIVALLVMIVKRRWKRWLASSPRSLFIEICRAQRLKWPQCRLLWNLAQSQKLADPASLFLRPECFEIGRLTVEMRPHAEELRNLREQLFAESADEKKSRETNAGGGFRDEEKATAALPLSPIPPTLDLPQWNIGTEIGTMD